MYKVRTAEDWKKHFELPLEYKVEGFMSYGAWGVEEQFRIFEKITEDMRPDVEIKRLSGFLANILEVRLEEKIYWFTVSYGGVQLSEHLHLACLLGSKRNIHLGSCGGLYTEASSIDWIIPTYSYGNESVSRTYERESKDNKHYPNNNLSETIKSKIPENKKYFEGPIVTCMAMMGETLEDVQNWAKEGYYGVEMETSTVFSISKHFNVPAASLLYISDNLIKGQIAGDESHLLQKSARDEMKKHLYRIGTEVLLGI